MREIKMKLYYQHDETGRITTKIVKFGEPIPWLGEQYGGHIGEGEFTGLKDRNGTEIYESDVVRGQFGHVGEVIYEAPSFIICWNDGDRCTIFQDSAHGVIEVIANIYDDQ